MVALKYVLVPVALVAAKNIVEMITFRDENGKLHRRLAPEEYRGGVLDGEESRLLQKRDLEIHPPVDLGVYLSNRPIHRTIDVPDIYLDSQISVLTELDIFASYSRNDEKSYDMFRDPESDLIVIAPTNAAITALAKKPWQFPMDIDTMEQAGSSERDIDNAIHNNIVNFVRSHVVAYQKDTKTSKDGTVLLQSKQYSMQHSNGKGGDVLLKREGEKYCVASVVDEVFHDVQNIYSTKNGVILVIDATLSRPGA